MGTVGNIARMGTGLERQHKRMGRAWELYVRGWGGVGNKYSGSGWVRGCNSNPCKTLLQMSKSALIDR